jgi:signal transduction histidine kinase
MLDDLGLLPALTWYVTKYSERTGVRASLSHQGIDRRFAAPIETAAYRIVQEALTNVARHADVSEVAVRAWAMDGMLQVEVEDTGRGFEPDAVRSVPSSGLSGMRERIMLLGGQLDVVAAPGRGVRVTAELPLAADT